VSWPKNFHSRLSKTNNLDLVAGVRRLDKKNPTTTPERVPPHWYAWLPAALLLLATLALYWPAVHCDFINFDDPDYVTANPHVQIGLTWTGIQWAFLHTVSANWHPLTMVSHMVDCQLFGLKPAGHHFTSVLLHALNAALVFMLLRQLTGRPWRSLLVAALFAVHPLRVESVVWVSERKDVLSGCFGLLSLLCYVRYAQNCDRPPSAIRNPPEENCFLSPAYWLAWICLTLGLMCKAMLVTWPFVMLLLDFWPLQRFQPGRIWRLVREKTPFLALAAIISIVTFLVQQHMGAMQGGESWTFGARLGNALLAYARYLEKMFWPAKLAIFYPHPGAWSLVTVLVAGGCLLGLTALFFALRRRQPVLLMGWLWFVGILVPVIGLVQVGSQAMADRYTYLPSIGILLLTVWGAAELTLRWPGTVKWAAGIVTVGVCLVLTRQQLGWWRDSQTLYQHALTVTDDNYIAHNLLGLDLMDHDYFTTAADQFQTALRLKPDFAFAHNNLGNALYKQDQPGAAIVEYQAALHLAPAYAPIHRNLGIAFFKLGQVDDAIAQYQTAIQLQPDDAKAHYVLGIALGRTDQLDQAIHEFRESVRLNPTDPLAHNNLGNDLAKNGQMEEAIREFRAALRLDPACEPAKKNLAQALGQPLPP